MQLSVYNESAWEFDATRNECYLHQFLKTQPELNLRSAAVQEELEVSQPIFIQLRASSRRRCMLQIVCVRATKRLHTCGIANVTSSQIRTRTCQAKTMRRRFASRAISVVLATTE
jgi:Alpha amylase, catalytic domain